MVNVSKKKISFVYKKAASKMRKNRTVQQDELFLEFMQDHKDIARALTRGQKLETNAAWAHLTKALNACGPPIKSQERWRRIWKDWKCSIKKKSADRGLSHNYEPMTPTEEALAAILNFDKSAANEPEDSEEEDSSSQFSLQKSYEQDPEDLFNSPEPKKKLKIESKRSTSSSEPIAKRDRASRSTNNAKLKRKNQQVEDAEDPLVIPPKKSKTFPKSSHPKADTRASVETSSEYSEDSETLQEIADELHALNKTAKSAAQSIAKMCALMERGLVERQKHNALLMKLLDKNK
nr:uncharacterized protein LOC108055991 [Drosophila takahashii]